MLPLPIKEQAMSSWGAIEGGKLHMDILKRRRLIMWVIIGVAVGLIAYGAWLGQNI